MNIELSGDRVIYLLTVDLKKLRVSSRTVVFYLERCGRGDPAAAARLLLPRRTRRGSGGFELCSMDRITSSSAVASGIDDLCSFAKSNPPCTAVRMAMLRVLGSCEGPRQPFACILSKPPSIRAAQRSK